MTTTIGGYNNTGNIVIGMHRAGAALHIRINGVVSNTAPAGSVDVSAAGKEVTIGGRGPASMFVDGYYGDLSEIVAVAGPITPTDLAGIESSLRTKYGVK